MNFYCTQDWTSATVNLYLISKMNLRRFSLQKTSPLTLTVKVNGHKSWSRRSKMYYYCALIDVRTFLLLYFDWSMRYDSCIRLNAMIIVFASHQSQYDPIVKCFKGELSRVCNVCMSRRCVIDLLFNWLHSRSKEINSDVSASMFTNR